MGKKKITVNLTASLAKQDYVVTDVISGTINLQLTHAITIAAVTVHVVGYMSTFAEKKGTMVEDKNVFLSTPRVIALCGKKKANSKKNVHFSIPAGSHPFKFNHPPIEKHISSSCMLHMKLGVTWELVTTLILQNNAEITENTVLSLHNGRKEGIDHIPSTIVLEKQMFLTHLPIHYKCVLHKTSFIAGETVAMTLDIKNNTRMTLVSMKCDLKQYWKTKKRSEEFTCLRFEVAADPFFPLLSNTEIEKRMEFQLPSSLLPSIFENVKDKSLTPLLLSYGFELDFMTEKEDHYVVRVPIVVEDNFPARSILAPPPPAIIEPVGVPNYCEAKSAAVPAYMAPPPEQYQAQIQKGLPAPPPEQYGATPSYAAAPTPVPTPGAYSHYAQPYVAADLPPPSYEQVTNGSLYPQLPDATVPSYVAPPQTGGVPSYAAPPAYNPSFN